jgi:PAS domain S-box-containing protein
MAGSQFLYPHPRASRLFVGAACGLAVVVALGAAMVGAYISSSRWVEHSLEVRQQLYEWRAAVLDADTSARTYVTGGQDAVLESYASALGRERAAAIATRRLVDDNPTQVRNVEIADRQAQVVIDDFHELVALGQGGRRDEARTRLESEGSKLNMDKFRADIHDLRAEEEHLLIERRAKATSQGHQALAAAILLTLASCGLLALGWRREAAHDLLMDALAADARGRLKALSELAVALSEARTRSEVAEVIVDHGMRAAGADTCTLYELNDTGTALELIGDRGVAPGILERIRQISDTSGNPATFATMKSGATLWAESTSDYARVYPSLATMKADGQRAQAFWSVPLVAESRPLGLLGAGFYQPRKFSADERAFVETLTSHCAQAFLRASRLEQQDEAQRLLATTLRSIGDAVIATDSEGLVTLMNPIAETLTGWTEEAARGKPLDDVFCILCEPTRAPAESPVAKVLREGRVVGLANHTVLRSKSGAEIPIDDSGAPIRNESGRILGVVLVFRDATHEKRDRARSDFLAKAGEALVASLDYPSTLATVAGFAVPTLADWCAIEILEPGAKSSRQVAVAHVDPGKVRFAREVGERYPPDPNALTGVPQVIRTGKSELYSEIPQALLEAAAKDAEHLRMIRDLSLKSAMVVPLRVRDRTFGAITFVHAESGRRYAEGDLRFAEDFARRAAMAIENAVALKETEEARAREHARRDEAEMANRAKDQFLATVSHELRSPLNAILGWAVILRTRKSPDDADRGLAVIERNARQQAKLIDDVLDISRIISGKLALHLGATNIADAMASAIETVTPAAQAKDIRISIEVPNEPLTITADSDRLQQIAWNLLSNAVKFTPKGGHVTVRAYRDGSEVCICVTDSGEGIRSEALPILFEAFQQADASITRRHGGLGLGLAIVKQLVSAHGGTVRAESEGEGKGATFVVRLPARSAVPAIAGASRPVLEQPAHVAAIAGAPRLHGLRLLVVDDEEDALGLVSEVLRGQGAEVHVATSAREALETFRNLRPDVVVSDIGMPEMDGFALIRTIRALPTAQGGGTPAIALTAYARSEDAQRAFLDGYQMHLAKPVELLQLVTVVARVAGRSLGSA